MSSLAKLEHLSLLSKLTSELLNHTGIEDKTLAEFIISLHSSSKDFAAFQRKLGEVGAEFEESFVLTLDRLIRTLSPRSHGGLASKSGTRNGTEKTLSNWEVEDNDEERVAKVRGFRCFHSLIASNFSCHPLLVMFRRSSFRDSPFQTTRNASRQWLPRTRESRRMPWMS